MYRRQQADTGGPGKFRGGATISMMYTPHDVDLIPTKIMHAIGVEQPGSAGIAGGLPSCTNQFVLKRRSNIADLLARGLMPQNLNEVNGELEVASGITPTSQARGDVYHCIGMGGGGYGDPLDRDPARVLRDVINGLVTPEAAAKTYGVIAVPNPPPERRVQSGAAGGSSRFGGRCAIRHPDRSRPTGATFHVSADNVGERPRAGDNATDRLAHCFGAGG